MYRSLGNLHWKGSKNVSTDAAGTAVLAYTEMNGSKTHIFPYVLLYSRHVL